MSVAPYLSACPARYIHHCSPRFATLASSNSAPREAVETSRGSKIFRSVPTPGVLVLSMRAPGPLGILPHASECRIGWSCGISQHILGVSVRDRKLDHGAGWLRAVVGYR